MTRRTVPLLTTAGFYIACWALGTTALAEAYTPEWTARRIAFFAMVSLGAVLFGRGAAWLWSLAGYLVGVALGELIGGIVYAQQRSRLDDQLLDPSFTQNWEPHHPGWAIATGVFLGATAIGLFVESRRASRSTGPAVR